MIYKYHLLTTNEAARLGKSGNKRTCPNCGYKKRFVPYVDVDLSEAGNEFGKCERVNNCGHHQYPKSEAKEWNPRGDQETYTYVPDGVLKSLYKRGGECSFEGAFMQWASKLAGYSEELAYEILGCYMVSTQQMVKDSKGNAGTAFPFVDFQMHTTDIQFKAFNGLKTDHSAGVNWAHSALKKAGKLPESRRRRALFGEHLLSKDYIDDAPHVHIFEAPKTAIMAAMWFYTHHRKPPQRHVFLAAGALTFLSYLCIDDYYINRMKPVFARCLSVTLWPDLSEGGTSEAKWLQYAEAMQEQYGGNFKLNTSLNDYATDEQVKSGSDLADFLSDLSGLAFEPAADMQIKRKGIDFSKFSEGEGERFLDGTLIPPHTKAFYTLSPQEERILANAKALRNMKTSNPALQNMIDTFGLIPE